LSGFGIPKWGLPDKRGELGGEGGMGEKKREERQRERAKLKEQEKKVKVKNSKEREVHHKCKEELEEEVWEGQRGGLKSGNFRMGKGKKYSMLGYKKR
jgi:hypothetical protein